LIVKADAAIYFLDKLLEDQLIIVQISFVPMIMTLLSYLLRTMAKLLFKGIGILSTLAWWQCDANLIMFAPG